MRILPSIGMIKYCLVVIISLSALDSFAQQFKDLGCAEKLWVFCHPFSAFKAKRITLEVKNTVDSVAAQKVWPKIESGGIKDAFRHGLWMAMLSSRIGYRKAIWLGKAHEKKNKIDFKKSKLEEGALPDLRSVQMDLYNNKVAGELGKVCKKCSSADLVILVLEKIEGGEFQVIKMDEKGNSLDSMGLIIEKKDWMGKWENNRVLVPSH